MFKFIKNLFSKKLIKDKFIIVVYIDCGNLNDEVPPHRIQTINETENYVGEVLKKDKSPLEEYVDRVVIKLGMEHLLKHDDLLHVMYIPTRDVSRIEILKF